MARGRRRYVRGRIPHTASRDRQAPRHRRRRPRRCVAAVARRASSLARILRTMSFEPLVESVTVHMMRPGGTMLMHHAPPLHVMDYIGPAIGAVLFVLVMSLVKEPARQRFNAIFVAGAGGVYLSGGFGPWAVLYP